MSQVKLTKRAAIFGWAVAGFVALLSLLDLVLGIPFSGQMLMDILFLVGAGILGYLAFDAWQDVN
ncbi:hypothetical protein [Stratiformator vulcanicus]|uniref:Uncharacterized protein n=1 Tax=Stratiformator vulcanicus TaxID=2527980 RepID=A0A517R471_9PLAN|nr:hypothetical protein [Stratiformator vulcanicus]QDT38684.1 hypothetical protein Pan189_30800 [Stratiformator vulcanicus]